MGGLCSCFHVPDVQDNNGLNNSSSTNCYCPKCCYQKLMNKHGNVLGRQGTQSTTSSNQQATSSYSSVTDENSTRSRVELEPIRQSNTKNSQRGKLLDSSNKKSESSSVKILPLGVEKVTSYKFVSPDEEDVCPTCLEEYDEENPKIITKCSHHYHLSCIYEWMERSANCPICGKLMLFDE